MPKILDGRLLAQRIKEDLKKEITLLKEKTGRVPHLVILMIGRDEGASAYANSQQKTAFEIGIQYELRTLPENILEGAVIDIIKELNRDTSVHGIMIHKPVPAAIHYRRAANYIDTAKDLEGINVTNIGKMIFGETTIIPCTPAAVMAHIKSIEIPIRGKDAVIVGRSEIVGKPLSLLLLQEEATVTICHRATSAANKLIDHIKRADILVAALGRPFFVKGEWIKEGAIVIDVGINQLDGKIVGDVEFTEAQKRAGYITPVPGGVGPVTVVMLMRNGIEAFKTQINNHNKF